MQKLKNALSSASALNVADKILKSGYAFLLSVFIARYLGPAEFGLYSLLLSYSYVTTALNQGGTDATISRALCQNNVVTIDLLYAIIIRVSLAAILLLTLVAYNKTGSISINEVVLGDRNILIICMYIAVSSMLILEPVLISIKKTGLLFKVTAYVATLFFLVKLISIYFFKDVWLKFLIDSIEIGLMIILGYKFLSPTTITIDKRLFKKSSLARFAMDSFPYWLNSIFLIVYSRADQFLVASYLDVRTLGLYAAVMQITNLALLPLGAAIGATLPNIIKLSGEASLQKALIKRYFLYILICSMAWSLILFLSGEFILKNVFGSEFDGAHQYLFFFSFVVLFNSVGMLFGNVAISMNYNWLPIFRSAVGLITALTFGYFSIPHYGLAGAVLTAAASSFMANIACYLMVKRFYEIFY